MSEQDLKFQVTFPMTVLRLDLSSGEKFQDLEEMEIIHDLRVSIPTKW